MDDLTEKARQLFANDQYATQLSGIRIEHADAEKAVCSLAIADHHKNAAGVVMGGALFTLADLAFAVAANTGILAKGGDEKLWMSLNSSISFVRATSMGTLTATAHPLKMGRSTCLFDIDIRDDGNRLVASIQTTGIKL